MKKISQEEILQRFRQVHGDLYDYSNVVYINYHTPVGIICPIHGMFYQRPHVHISGAKCPICSAKDRGKKKCLTTDEYIRRSKEVHGDKYDYSLVNYIDSKSKICIICPIHGKFWQTPFNHLKGDDCPICAKNKHKKILYGVAFNDLEETINNKEFYSHWISVLNRCFNKKIHEKHQTYKDCTLCEEWKYLSNFKRWFNEHYVKGWHLDKDILVKGNKIYSPQTCCFVPQEINTLFTRANARRGNYSIGVSFNKSKKKYETHVNINGKTKYFGGFNTEHDAFLKYKYEKEKEIVRIADKYKKELPNKVYNALINYKVDETD